VLYGCVMYRGGMESGVIVSVSVRTVEHVTRLPDIVIARLVFAVRFVRTGVPQVGLMK